MSREFGHGTPDGAVNWHPSRGTATNPARPQLPWDSWTEAERAAAVWVSEAIRTQLPTNRESPRAFYSQRISSPIDHPDFADAQREVGELDIFLSQHAENRMFDHLEGEAPLEAIGLVLGRVGREQFEHQERRYVEVKEVIPMGPADGTSRTTLTSASITHTGWIRAWQILEYLRKEDPETYEDVHIIGWYHQHPIGNILSSMDVFLHNQVFDEPHQITFVRDSRQGAKGVFYRTVPGVGDRSLVPVGHFRQTGGYYYENRKPVAYDIMEYLEKLKTDLDLTRKLDPEAIRRSIRQQMIPWHTEAEIVHEMEEAVQAAGMLVLKEMIRNPEIIATEEKVMVDDVVDLGVIDPALSAMTGFIEDLGQERDVEVEIIIEEEEVGGWKAKLSVLRRSISEALIRLGKKK